MQASAAGDGDLAAPSARRPRGAKAGWPALKAATCPSVAPEQLPASTAAGPRRGLKAEPCLASRPACGEIARQAEGDARSAGDQARAVEGSAERQRDRDRSMASTTDEPIRPWRRSPRARRAIGAAPAAHRLRRPHGRRDGGVWRASQRRRSGSVIGIERMVLHAGFGEQPVADEEMALVDRAARLAGRPGRPPTPWRAERVGQRLRPPGRYCPPAVESKVEQYLKRYCSAALAPQPVEGGQRLGDRLGRGDGAALERDDPGLAIAGDAAPSGTPMNCVVRHACSWPACWRDRWRR